MTFLEDRDFNDVPTIPEYYRGKTIFLTGGSDYSGIRLPHDMIITSSYRQRFLSRLAYVPGFLQSVLTVSCYLMWWVCDCKVFGIPRIPGFMGKVLLEKLLYSCTDLDRIYLLLRNKKGVPPEHRLSAIYKSPCFDRLRKEKPDVFETKVFFIAGDVSEIGLGLTDDDRTLIINRTHIIFHVAASVRFDDHLKAAIKLNLRGTKEILELATEVRNLECFTHVSTSYSNTNRDPVEEIMYPPLADWRDTLKVCDELDDRAMQVLTAKYIGEMPNTYVFSKQLAEHVVYEYKGKLPVVIIRPSIVVSSIKDPIPGWIENFNGPTGIIVACGKGILRTIYSKPDIISDYIPVDVAIKCFIASTWSRGTKKLEPTDDVPIYNSCAGSLNNITVHELISVGKQIIASMPLRNMIWCFGATITSSLFMFNVQVLLLHLLPAVIIDMLLWIFGQKTMLVKIQRRIYVANLALHYYTIHQWTFSNVNFVTLRSKIKEEDQEDFYYDLENVDRYEFFRQCCNAGRKYLLHETEDDIPKNRAHYARLQFVRNLTTCIFFGFIFWWVMSTECVQNIFTVTD